MFNLFSLYFNIFLQESIGNSQEILAPFSLKIARNNFLRNHKKMNVFYPIDLSSISQYSFLIISQYIFTTKYW